MASNKVTILCILAILLIISSTLTNAIRPDPASGSVTPAKIREWGFDEAEKAEVEDSCEGGEEECLMRRTLAAHIDYIYTQKIKP
ncbi:phytosulfokines [Manihot esculenta]|uniref:Phytosulfokine n=1 Tax=Manihot esculenta TaxID=3983 RepID=A0A2C9VIU7_MANES|nr:phytosulfokines [Manihot esculenta]OAY45399.1 hypothetical protein MANES_07G057300v8 [Manihot esculenta]